ncbi:terpene synthase/cyclase family protein [Solirubrobacter sp. CPCC 204708]|uniref:Terpene synthase/cyclase family protein n=1 Tax=Solirubrobacter deserti TaxID=2282478 RepID=A0ABT4RBK2_9ACTN|nr:terpene synthase/cyclase family protein [Solirubrobacter deserti]
MGIACYAEAVDRWLSDPAVPLPEHMRACFSELRAELS